MPSDAFWPDMSAETEGERVFGGIRISGAPEFPIFVNPRIYPEARSFGQAFLPCLLRCHPKSDHPVKALPKTPPVEPAPVQTPEKKYEFPSTDLLAEPKPGRGMNEVSGLPQYFDRMSGGIEAYPRKIIYYCHPMLPLQNPLGEFPIFVQSFGVRVTVSNISCGPAVTQYELKLEQGVKVNQITKLSDYRGYS